MEKASESYAIQHIHLRNFRNYEELQIEFSPYLNIIYGTNGQGKTNLLESFYFLSAARLLRGTYDHEGIKEGQHKGRVEGTLQQLSKTITINIEKGTKKCITLNGTHLKRNSDLLGHLPCVCISSLDMNIIQGEPAERRFMIDLILSQMYPSYLQHLTYYKRALEQRNTLLKQNQGLSRTHIEALEAWEEQLGTHGTPLRSFRKEFVKEINIHGKELHCHLGNNENLELGYETRDELQNVDDLIQRLKKQRERDLLHGTTSIGPHRDNITIEINKKSAKIYGSQGQQRTAMISIKTAIFLFMAKAMGKNPILLLDDIFSDLDKSRRNKLMKMIEIGAAQVFLTCTEREQVEELFCENAHYIHIQNGRALKV